MTSPIFLQDLPIEQLEKLSKNDIQRFLMLKNSIGIINLILFTTWLYMVLKLRTMV